ncbi:hypothetical protein CV770_06305 [Bradyrhizobium sp. AC87j1]|uniref:hypothetical protein n=1 Tax=Bradyrhizobium sp. AC87j1 TaxID=2055894 RepID=UPI000D485243|nr:hypothetical protein [Bradyrhizobium sp. AC87j1]PPQ20364.1 hypothetical protein CV770_06305 [Bradyrhizobium sp. AC87j1]
MTVQQRSAVHCSSSNDSIPMPIEARVNLVREARISLHDIGHYKRSRNHVTGSGVPAQAWPDWFSPTSRIWIDAFNEGAVYSPDGVVIQFDNGAIWQRGLPPLRRR